MQRNNEEKLSKININWYPGHMAKTRKQIEEDLKLIDVVIELLDSRIPSASRNPDIRKLTQNKKRIIILNKCDLSDEQINKKWVEKLSKEAPVLLTDANTGKGIDKISKKIEDLMKEEIAKQLEVGNKPGVTKSKQWIRIGKNQELLDTPGVLWPKFENEEIALNLAFTGTIKDDILEKTEVAYELLKVLYEKYNSNVVERYKLIENDIEKIENSSNSIYELMQIIGRKRGALVSGGNVDDEKTARIILEDFRSCKLGKISLEEP